MELDESVDGFGASVGRAAGVEVAQELASPPAQRDAEAGDLGDRAGGQGRDDLLRDGPAGGRGVLVVGGSDLLGAPPGDFDLDVLLARGERCVQPGTLPVGQVLLPGAQGVADPVQRVALAAPMAGGVLLDPAADVVDDLGGELDDVEGVMPTSA